MTPPRRPAGPDPAARHVLSAPALSAVVVLAGAAALVAPASGQEPDPVPADTVATDTVPAADTLPADSLPGPGVRADTVPGDTVPADTAAVGRGRRGGADVEQVQENLAGGGFPERDSVFRRLMEEPGYRVVEYRGETVSLDVPDRRIRLRDSAQANYADAALRADSITYRSRLQFMSAQGRVRLVSPDQRRMTTDSVLYYDVSRLKGTVLDARTSFAARGAEWQVRGDAVPVGSRTLYVNRGTFTSCNREDPHYYFRAGQIKMVSQDVIAAWPVTLYIADVPVFWLPFFAHDIRPDRRSGIVAPEFGFNDIVQTGGARRSRRSITGAGYYWAINRFMDAKFTVDWFSGDFTRLIGQYRYNFEKKFINGNIRVSRDFADQNNLTLDAAHEQQLTPDTRLQANVRFVTQEEQQLNRSFETSEQTQDIRSDVGLDHEFGFGNVSLSGSRVQSLGTRGRLELTLPEARLSLSPVTLFEAPRSRAGPLDNLTLSPGGLSFSRNELSRDRGDDVLTMNASVGPSLRLGELSLSTSGSFSRRETTPFRTVVDTATGDTVFTGDLDTRLRSTINWSASTDYQIDLMGSTTLSPDVRVSGAFFRSRTPPDTFSNDTVPDTGGEFVQAPTRFSFGANMSTDLFGFYPGFGPFSRIRHKFSPRFNWSFSPAATLADSSLAEVPGFPGGRAETDHTLSVTVNQTIEAKMPVGDGGGGGETAQPAEAGGADQEGGEAPGRDAEGPRRERNVTLLSIRSDALRFDFNQEGPALDTDRWSNSIRSDLFRGLDLTMAFDLQKGSGADRTIDPFLSQINASVSFRSGQSLADLFGLGRGGGGRRGGPPDGRGPGRRGGRGGLRRRGPRRVGRRGGSRGMHEAGPWNLSLDYTLGRSRGDGSGVGTVFGGAGDEQTLRGNISLQPTPNWSMQWSTSYNIEEKEFSSQQVRLTRNLHRWRAEFAFNRATNGNFTFRFFVTLTDAPELRVPFSTESETAR